jgi:hypothetical protein
LPGEFWAANFWVVKAVWLTINGLIFGAAGAWLFYARDRSALIRIGVIASAWSAYLAFFLVYPYTCLPVA